MNRAVCRHRVTLLFVLVVAAFAGAMVVRGRAQSAPATPHTVYFLHGRIYTNDPQHPWAAAMAIREGKIFCIGGLDQIMLECGGGQEGAETVQLKGNFVVPGFNDAHVHLGGAGADMLEVRLDGSASVDELQKRLAESVATHQGDEWITGSGWDHTLWPDKAFPSKQQLDAGSPKNPVLLTHVYRHGA